MQSFAEFMAESFNSSARLTWDYPRRSYATAKFSVDDIKVVVSFEERAADGPWHVLFEVDKNDTTAAVHSAFEIFNGVFQAVEEFAEVREPETLVFATKRDRLAGIYQTYLRKESATLERRGYKLEGLMLKRMKPSGWKG
jgi:hypothetical protein